MSNWAKVKRLTLKTAISSVQTEHFIYRGWNIITGYPVVYIMMAPQKINTK